MKTALEIRAMLKELTGERTGQIEDMLRENYHLRRRASSMKANILSAEDDGITSYRIANDAMVIISDTTTIRDAVAEFDRIETEIAHQTELLEITENLESNH